MLAKPEYSFPPNEVCCWPGVPWQSAIGKLLLARVPWQSAIGKLLLARGAAEQDAAGREAAKQHREALA